MFDLFKYVEAESISALNSITQSIFYGIYVYICIMVKGGYGIRPYGLIFR